MHEGVYSTKLLWRRRERAKALLQNGAPACDLFFWMQEELQERLFAWDPLLLQKGGSLLELGELCAKCRASSLDEQPAFLPNFQPTVLDLASCSARALAAMETASIDLVISIQFLHLVKDQAALLSQVFRVLRPGGVLAFCFLGDGSLVELKEMLLELDWAQGNHLKARMHPLPTSQQMVEMLGKAGFTKQVVEQESLQVRYTSFKALRRDIQALGESNALLRRWPWSKGAYLCFTKWIQERTYKNDGFCVTLLPVLAVASR